jgi:hypothetical protein
MKGAMAEPLAKIIKAPKNNSVKIMGSSQNFFLTLRKPHKSLTKSMVKLLVLGFKASQYRSLVNAFAGSPCFRVQRGNEKNPPVGDD